MDSCIFCKIVAGEIPSYKVYEDEHALAFLDIHPCAPGHTVVIPKQHSETELDTEPEEAAAVMQAVQHASRVLKEKLGPAGFNIGWNHGRIAGQAINHWHVHIIPRNAGDNGGSMHSIVKTDGPLVEEMAKKVCGF